MSTLPSSDPLEVHLGYWLRRVSNHVSGAFARKLQARQTSVTEWVVLQQIQGRSNLTAGQLADLLGMTRGAISKVLDKLESKQWVTRSINPEDSRVQWLALTSLGEQILPELAQIADSNDAEFFDCLSGEEQSTLKGLLEKLTQIHEWSDTPTE